jgi:hypothetical protein
MVRTYANAKGILIATKNVERVIGELGETPFEPLRKEQEEGMHNDMLLEK